MSLQDIQNGIKAVQQGDYRTADQLLRQGLNSPEVVGSVRAIALMWLAATNPSTEFKIQCYQAALQVDPANADIKKGLAELISAQAPPQKLYSPPSQPLRNEPAPQQLGYQPSILSSSPLITNPPNNVFFRLYSPRQIYVEQRSEIHLYAFDRSMLKEIEQDIQRFVAGLREEPKSRDAKQTPQIAINTPVPDLVGESTGERF